MSTYPDDLGYFDAVQVYFTELTGRAMFFSGRDLELLETWRRQGASAAIVCRGVREAVEAMPDDDPPRDLHACRDYIEPRVERARSRSAGRPTVEADEEMGGGIEAACAEESDEDDGGDDAMPPLLARALDNIERAGRQCEATERRQLYRRAWRRVRTWARQREEAVDEPEDYERLMELEQRLVERHLEILDDDARQELEHRVREESEALLDRMTDEARAEHLAARRRRLLVEDWDFVPILD